MTVLDTPMLRMHEAGLNEETIVTAWHNWVEFHYGLDCEEVLERFSRCVDPTLKSNFGWGHEESEEDPWEFTPECAAGSNSWRGRITTR